MVVQCVLVKTSRGVAVTIVVVVVTAVHVYEALGQDEGFLSYTGNVQIIER